MEKFNIISILIYICFFSIFFGCNNNPVKPEQYNEGAIHYLVNIQSIGSDSLHILLKINEWEYGDSIRLLAPQIYADNPFLRQSGINFHNLFIIGKNDKTVNYTTDSLQVGLYNTLSIAFPESAIPAIIEYDITFYYDDTTNSSIPYIDQKSGYLRGNFIFTIPYHNKDIVHIWRDNFEISVQYNIADGIDYYGDPIPFCYFNNPYELMFSTGAINAQLLYTGESGGQMFRFVSLPQEETIAPELITKAGEDFSTILDDITKIFDPITESPVSVILGPNSAGGLEGMNAFSILNPWEEDSIGWFNMIIAHEMIHCWIGIRVGDYEDPWWKEGTTSYLGYLIALRNDLCSDYFIRRKLLLDLSDNIGVNKFALSDPEVRSKIYAPGDDNCESLVYNKGAQVNMLIDRRIREISNGTATLPKILGNFVREFEGRPFYRSEYILFINEQSGADVSDIFKKYVETTGAIPGSVLTENCSALAEMKAFGDYMMPLQKRLITKSYTPEKLYAF